MTYDEAVAHFAAWEDDLTRRADEARRAACDVLSPLPDMKLCMADAARRTLQAADRRIRDGSPPTKDELQKLAEAMVDESVLAELEREGTLAVPGSATPARDKVALLRLINALAEFDQSLGDNPPSGVRSALGDLAGKILDPGFQLPPKLTTDSEAKKYVRTAVGNKRIDRLRKKDRAACAPLPGIDGGSVWLADHREQSPLTLIRAGEEAAILQDALATLEPDDRELLKLRYFDSLGWAEVASRLEITPGTARMRGVRALERLRTRPELAVLFEESEELSTDE